MAGLRSFAWPHLVPAKSSQADHSTPNSKASSDKDATDESEFTAGDPCIARRFSYGDQPRIPSIRTLPSRPELHSRASSPAITFTSTEPTPNRTQNPLVDSDDVSHDQIHHKGLQRRQSFRPALSPPLPPTTRIGLDRPMDIERVPYLSETLPSDRSSKLLRSQFVDDLDRRMSAVLAAVDRQNNSISPGDNTSVSLDVFKVEVLAPSPSRLSEDFDPDMPSPSSGFLDPSGHFVSITSRMPGFWSRSPEEALNLSRARRPGSSRTTSYDGSDNPRMTVVLPTPPSSDENGDPTSPTSASRLIISADDYFGPTLANANIAVPNESPAIMYTAPQTPMGISSRLLQSNYSFDGPGINPGSSRPSIKDFAMLHSSPAVLTRLRVLSPVAGNADSEERIASLHERDDQQQTQLDGIPYKSKLLPTALEGSPASNHSMVGPAPQTPLPDPAPEKGPMSDTTVVPITNDSLPSPVISTISEAPKVSRASQITELPMVPEVPAVPDIPGASNVPGVPNLSGAVGSIPATPGKEDKLHLGGRSKVIVKKLVRQCRKIVLQEPILGICLGSQLAKPTAVALRQLSKGLPLEPVADAAGASSIPAPV
ncbi:hypothetical protein PVAG01_05321 [Phlyctema vagabunda]|uniref:Uncharacterized protein n=1 Tax=Phlyctema vagabunda TaxID=108571 RepID=A0ABR4PJR5_9HELO